MNFLTGLSLATWARIGIAAVFLALVVAFVMRGNAIDDLRNSLAAERAAHAVTRQSVTTLRATIETQNQAIEDQRAKVDQAKRDLARAEAASASSAEVIDRLKASSRSVPAGPACEASDVVKGIWQ